MEARDYQRRAIRGAIKGFDDGAISGVVAMATGTGKTFVTHEVVTRRFDPEKYRTLIVGGVNIDVCNQMEAAFLSLSPKLAGLYGENGHSAPGIGVVMADRDEVNSRIIVGSIQTLLASNIEEYEAEPVFTETDVYMSGDCIFHSKVSEKPYLVSPRMDAILKHGRIELWVHDEVHHAPADGTLKIIKRMRALYDYLGLPPMKFMGNTATTVRPDGRALFNVCERIFYSYPLAQAQADGWLVPFAPPQQVVVDLGYNNPEDSEHDVLVDSILNWKEMVAKTWRDLCTYSDGSHRPTIIYTGKIHSFGGVEASKVLSASLNEHGIRSVHIDATTTIDTDGTILNKTSRIDVFKRLVTGDIDVICNCNVIIEGIDIPPIAAVFLLKKVNELVLTQIVGRGTRLFPGNDDLPAKEDLLLVDFTGQRLVTTGICSLMGYMVDEEGEFEPDWEPLFEEFAALWVERSEDIKAWLAELKEVDEEYYKMYEESLILCINRSPDFNKFHSRLIRKILALFGEDELLDARSLVDEGSVAGKDVVYKLAEIVASTDNDWHTDPDTGYLSLPVGAGESLFITPPNWEYKITLEAAFKEYLQLEDRDEKLIALYSMAINLIGKFTLWRVNSTKPYSSKAKPLYSDDNLIELFNSVFEYISNEMSPDEIFMKKGRKWKQRTTGGELVPPTHGQEYALNKLAKIVKRKIDLSAISKGEASRLIGFMAGLAPIKVVFNKIHIALSINKEKK